MQEYLISWQDGPHAEAFKAANDFTARWIFHKRKAEHGGTSFLSRVDVETKTIHVLAVHAVVIDFRELFKGGDTITVQAGEKVYAGEALKFDSAYSVVRVLPAIIPDWVDVAEQ